MSDTHERLWHEWYAVWHDADASKARPSYEEWLEARIEALERWGECASQALVYAATVTRPGMDEDTARLVDKTCMDLDLEWAALRGGGRSHARTNRHEGGAGEGEPRTSGQRQQVSIAQT